MLDPLVWPPHVYEMRQMPLREACTYVSWQPEPGALVAIERPASYGMSVGEGTWSTALAAGIIAGSATQMPPLLWPDMPDISEPKRQAEAMLIERRTVKIEMCGVPRTKDSNIIARLCDLYGGSTRAAKGNKRQRGPLYGIAGDLWQALAVGVVVSAKLQGRKAV
jgi:hypothetical protein